MQLWHGFIFLMLLAFLPEAANALPNFIVQPGSCADSSSFTLSCDLEPNQAGLFSAVACKTMKIFNAAALPMYCNLVGNPEFLAIMANLLTLYIIFWAITYISGMNTVTAGNAIMRVLKFAFIFYFITNQDLFFGIIYSFVTQVPEQIISIILFATGNPETTFYQHVDKGINDLFQGIFYPEVREDDGSTSSKFELRLFVLGFAIWKLVPGGGMLAGLFFGVVVGWLTAYFSIMVRYLLALMTLIFLLMLSPIFITSLMFEKTKSLWDEWIKMISSFMIQIVIVVTFVLMVEDFYLQFYEMIKHGYNEIVLKHNTKGYDVDFGTLTKIEKDVGVTADSAKEYIVDLEKAGLDQRPKDVDFLPWFTGELIIMAVVIYLTHTFMKFVPAFAGYLAGNPRFVNMIQRSGDVSATGPRAKMPFDDLRQKITGSSGNASKNTIKAVKIGSDPTLGVGD